MQDHFYSSSFLKSRPGRIIGSLLVILTLFGGSMLFTPNSVHDGKSRIWKHLPSFPHTLSTSSSAEPPCSNPYLLPGSLNAPPRSTPKLYHLTNYSVFHPTLNPPHKDLPVASIASQIVIDSTVPSLHWLKNRSILVVGDSIDRNAVTDLGREVFKPYPKRHTVIDGTSHPGFRIPGDPAHVIGVAHHEGLNLTIYNWFMKGVAAETDDKLGFEFYEHDKPHRFEGRLEEYFFPALEAGLVPRPDLVVFNTGLWDLRFYGEARDFELVKVCPTCDPDYPAPLSGDELQHHRTRFSSFIHTLRRRFPGSKFAYRTMHLPSEEAEQDVFSMSRVIQLEASNRLVVNGFREQGVEVMLWGEKVNGLHAEMYDPPLHFGPGAAQWLYADMMLEILKRSLLGEGGNGKVVKSGSGRWPMRKGKREIDG